MFTQVMVLIAEILILFICVRGYVRHSREAYFDSFIKEFQLARLVSVMYATLGAITVFLMFLG